MEDGKRSRSWKDWLHHFSGAPSISHSSWNIVVMAGLGVWAAMWTLLYLPSTQVTFVNTLPLLTFLWIINIIWKLEDVHKFCCIENISIGVNYNLWIPHGAAHLIGSMQRMSWLVLTWVLLEQLSNNNLSWLDLAKYGTVSCILSEML